MTVDYDRRIRILKASLWIVQIAMLIVPFYLYKVYGFETAVILLLTWIAVALIQKGSDEVS